MVPAVRRGAQAEPTDAHIVQSPAVQVGQRLRALAPPEHGVIVPGRLDIGRVQPLAQRPGLIGVRLLRALGQGQMCPLGEQVHRVQELHPLDLHHERDDASALVAAEAVKGLRFAVHAEGGGLFAVERTQAPEPAALLLQDNIVGYHVHDVDAASQLVKPRVRYPSHFFVFLPLYRSCSTGSDPI